MQQFFVILQRGAAISSFTRKDACLLMKTTGYMRETMIFVLTRQNMHDRLTRPHREGLQVKPWLYAPRARLLERQVQRGL